ncbi:hypothetical protein KEM54_005184 [Ascosphaera aggregata]|nr:hypothetical protein KEM54_005184 [Ascosphaera aggregata]
MATFSLPVHRFHDHSLVYGARRHKADARIVKITNGLSEIPDDGKPRRGGGYGEVADDRVGLPYLCGLPLKVRPLDPYSDHVLIKEWNLHLKDEIKASLNKFKYKFHDVSIGKYEPKFRDADSSTNTIIITIPKIKCIGPDPSWLPMCQKIYVDFILKKHTGVHVEMRDISSPLFIETKPLRCHDTIIPLWPAIRDRCLFHLRDQDQWLSVGCYRRSRLHDLELVTIVISVVPISPDLSPWQRIRDEILDDLKGFDLLDVAVEIIAEDSSSEEFYWSLDCVNEKDIGGEARLGRSLGVRHNYDRPFLTGSLGGFLTLKFDDSSVKTFGMTCFHCVEDHRPTTEHRLTWTACGIHPNEAGDVVEVLQPAQVDIERWKEYLRKEIGKIRTRNEWESDITESERSNQETESQFVQDPSSWKPSKTISELDQELKFVETSTRIKGGKDGTDDGLRLGRVYAASGKRIILDRTTLLDWALIEFAPERTPRSPSASSVPDSVRSTSNLPPPLPSQIKGYRTPLPGEPVFKLGRSSGLTHGVVNPVPETVHSFHGDRKQDYGDETIIIGTNPEHAPFSKRGDSGAWAISTKGEYLGHIWAGKKRTCATMITLATQTVEDIKKVTGAVEVEAGVDAL